MGEMFETVCGAAFGIFCIAGLFLATGGKWEVYSRSRTKPLSLFWRVFLFVIGLAMNLDARQRKALGLFRRSREIMAKEIGALFGFQPRTAALLCQRWVESGFLEVTDPARKS